MLRNQGAIEQRRELDQPDSVRVLPDETPGQLERQAALASAADSDDRQQARRGKSPLQLPDVMLATNEACAGCGQIVLDCHGSSFNSVHRARDCADARRMAGWRN